MMIQYSTLATGSHLQNLSSFDERLNIEDLKLVKKGEQHDQGQSHLVSG